ncbi:13725_t:CDS:2 [Cetraspora pellucida]|uniref:13725_t:CDS:1 n=1 Tax=Cetraspora pellucida TaxID=1433469 RepID=A0A9N9D4R8_9GLOM|nr:13725_t:CDS:2 [Cetraspora pellucida]
MISEKVKESESQDIREVQDVSVIFFDLIRHQTDIENNAVEDFKNRNKHQELETKIAALNHLVEHLNIEMAANNL